MNRRAFLAGMPLVAAFGCHPAPAEWAVSGDVNAGGAILTKRVKTPIYTYKPRTKLPGIKWVIHRPEEV